MLFMGSEEFPAESEYGRYIEVHGGYANAYTTTDHTAYYFNILPHGLLGALDRISQFFVAPVSFLSNFTNIVIGFLCFGERT
jgi:insulysin